MKKALILVSAMVFVASGCAWQQSRVTMDYGTSYQLQKNSQILNPEAEKNLAPAQGLDGQAASASVNRYRKSFEKQDQKAPSYTFNFGSSGK
jgi:hypothetical protein